MNTTRTAWGSKLGFVLAAAGSAVGLGNLWRFPYITAQNGGGAFLLIYLAILATVGLTLVLLETALGIHSKTDPVGAFRRIRPIFGFIGFFGVLAGAVIVPYYSVVGGWIIAYLVQPIFSTDSLSFEERFSTFISSPVRPVLFFGAFLGMTAAVVYRGIQNGIEKFSRVMMPLLFLLLLILTARSLTLPNAVDGVKFFFVPDFSKVNAETVLEALGQVFFSLSVGMGIYITFGSYSQSKEPVFKTMWSVPCLDTLVSLMTGLTIFPAVFAFGVPINAGPKLVFITLPQIFASVPFGTFFSVVFFFLLLIAALTSAFSLTEVVVTHLCDQWGLSRHRAVIGYSLVAFFMGTAVSLSFGEWSGFTVFGLNLFDASDFLASNILLPAGGLLTCLAAGWFSDTADLNVFESRSAQTAFDLSVKYLSPIAVGIVLLNATGLL